MKTPKWPQVAVEVAEDLEITGSLVVRAKTDTGRPVTPVFAVVMTVGRNLTWEEICEAAQAEMQRRYERAHPNGCPAR